MLSELKGKRILLILPKFFGYDRIIASNLTKAGALLTTVYEDMDEVSYFYRFINAYFPQHMPDIMNRYFLKQCLPIANELDYILLIRGGVLNPIVLEKLKKNVPGNCKFCMYQWDSTNNNKNALEIAKFFDHVSTFDPLDAAKYGWTYRPLFYIPEFVKNEVEDIDVLYMCSLHSKRIEVLNRLKRICMMNHLNLYRRVYSKFIVYYKRKYLNKREGYIDADDADISSVKMDVSESYQLYNRSIVVVDYTHPGQNGLTMRTIETLGCGKKLVTNNHYVLASDFYNPNNVFVYDNENVDIPMEFFKKPTVRLQSEIYENYSIEAWLKSIMCMSGTGR